MKRILIGLCCIFALLEYSIPSSGCTSAIISADANPYGRPLLWKHRDTSNIDNVVEYIPAQPDCHAYVALFNADDTKREQAWMGMNDAGFAVMNTASYNIKDDKVPEKDMDREGYLMSIALAQCVTVDDFGKLLASLPKPLGVEANFGVIDAYGNGAYFETNNHSFVRFDLKDAPEGVLVRTNYSHSGRPDEGFGFVREDNANHLLVPFAAKKEIVPELLTETLSRSFWHSLKGKDMASGGDRWVVDQDFIPRYKSTATIVIEGCKPIPAKGNAIPTADDYIMWTGLGYPPCSEIKAVRCSGNGVPEGLRAVKPNGHSPLADNAKAKRDKVFPLKKGNGEKYIDMSALFNDRGTGYVQEVIPVNLETYRRERALRDKRNGGGGN